MPSEIKLKTQLICACGNQLDTFGTLINAGFARSEIQQDLTSFAARLQEIIPRLICNVCGTEGEVVAHDPQSIRIIDKDTVCTISDSGIFHRLTCKILLQHDPENKEYMPNYWIARERGASPCGICKPPRSIKPKHMRNRMIATDRGHNRVFHVPSCGFAKQINSSDEIEFDDAEDAVLRGYSPCKWCKPTTMNGGKE
jgi:hypothetical protein